MAATKFRFKKGEHACAYCGERPGVEKEHVVPRGFFDANDNGPRIIVPACGECNDKYADEEEYLRMLFTMEFRGGEHESAKSLMNGGKAYRALEKNKKLLTSLVGDTKQVRVVTRGGVELPGTYTAIPVKPGKIEAFIEKIIRGVFFAETGTRIPKEYTIAYWTDDQRDISEIPKEALDAMYSKPIGVVGNNVLMYRFAPTTEDPFATMWFLSFYQGLTYVAFTKAPG